MEINWESIKTNIIIRQSTCAINPHLESQHRLVPAPAPHSVPVQACGAWGFGTRGGHSPANISCSEVCQRPASRQAGRQDANKHNSQFRFQFQYSTSSFKLQTSNFKLQVRIKLQISTFRLHTSNFQISSFKLKDPSRKLQSAKFMNPHMYLL